MITRAIPFKGIFIMTFSMIILIIGLTIPFHFQLFYLLFLALFSYVMVSDQLSKRWPGGWEGLLIFWVVTFIAEEIRQVEYNAS